jgi:hypothetical protein
MGWYCPVEKRECDRDLQGNGPCLSCPWPSRQQTIEPKAVEPVPPTFDLECQWHKEPCKVHRAGAGNGHCYSCGLAEGIRECRKAVENEILKITPIGNATTSRKVYLGDVMATITKAIAALEGVKGEK